MNNQVRRAHGSADGEWTPLQIRKLLNRYVTECWATPDPLHDSIKAHERTVSVNWLIEQLWACHEPLPRLQELMFRTFEEKQVQTYADAARVIDRDLALEKSGVHRFQEKSDRTFESDLVFRAEMYASRFASSD